MLVRCWNLCFLCLEFLFCTCGISMFRKNVDLVLSCTLGIATRFLGLTPGYQSDFIHGIFLFDNDFGCWGSTIIFLWNWKPWMFSEGLKRGVCLDDLDFGFDWNALIKQYREIRNITSLCTFLNNTFLWIIFNKKGKIS